MGKRTTTLMTAIETTDIPADQFFVVDGENATLQLKIFALTGTTPTITATVAEMRENGFTLAYDAQTANFTVGRTVRGLRSGATGFIMKDTDGGATGTLELLKVIGHFQDNEPLMEIEATTPGKAVANGLAVRALTVGGVWANTGPVSVDSAQPFKNPDVAVAAGGEGGSGELIVVPRRFRLRISKNATVWTKAEFAVQLMQSGGII